MHVDDRRGHVAGGRPAVEQHLDRVAEHLLGLVGVGGGGQAGAVRAAHGERAGAARAAPGRPRGRASAPRRCRGCRRGPTAETAAAGTPGSAGPATAPRPAPGRTAGRRRPGRPAWWPPRRARAAASRGLVPWRPAAQRTAAASKASAPTPYTVSVGRTTSWPRWTASAAAAMPASRSLVGRSSRIGVRARDGPETGRSVRSRVARLIVPAARSRTRPPCQVGVVAYVAPAAGRGEHGRGRLALHVRVLGADPAAGPQQPRGDALQRPGSPRARRRRTTARRAGRARVPRPPPTRRRPAGCTAGCTATTSTVPSRSGNAVSHVAEAQVDAAAGQVARGPGVRRPRRARRRARRRSGTSVGQR